MPSRPANLSRRAVAIRKKPTLDFSLTGLVYTCLMLFMGLAAIHSQANLLFAVFGIMIGVLLVSGLISKLVLRRLEVARHLPETLHVGQTATIVYEFDNRKRIWPSLSVTLYEISAAEIFSRQPVGYLLHVAPAQRASVPTQVMPVRRGLYHLDRFQLATSFPFGFIKRASDRRLSDGILVHPPLAAVDRNLLALCLSAESSGSRMKPRRGGTDEFYGVKEFRTGENPRWIYWKRSARTGTLVAREMTHVAPPRLVIFLDTFIDPEARSAGAHALVEQAIAMAASLISRTIDEGLAVGLHAWSHQILTITPSRGKRHARDLLAALAKLPLNTIFDSRDLLDSAPNMLHSRATGVLVTPRADGASQDPPQRSTWLVISADSAKSQRWFTFPEGTDFESMIPMDQLATLEGAS